MKRLPTVTTLLFFFVLGTFGCSEPADDDGQDISCDPTSSDAEQCPSDTVCTYKHLSGRQPTDEGICHEYCESDADCPSHRPNCTPEVNFSPNVCSEADYNPRPCDPEATGDDCECGIGDDQAYLVEGTGDDCEILDQGVTACFEQAMTCMNACVREFYRYELGDGTAIIALGFQGQISDGWQNDGQFQDSPQSCPAIVRDDEI
jgi:hypothetical protein